MKIRHRKRLVNGRRSAPLRPVVIHLLGDFGVATLVKVTEVSDLLGRGWHFATADEHIRYVESCERGEVPSIGVIKVEARLPGTVRPFLVEQTISLKD